MTICGVSELANVNNHINVLAVFKLLLFTQEFSIYANYLTHSLQLDDGKPQRC